MGRGQLARDHQRGIGRRGSAHQDLEVGVVLPDERQQVLGVAFVEPLDRFQHGHQGRRRRILGQITDRAAQAAANRPVRQQGDDQAARARQQQRD